MRFRSLRYLTALVITGSLYIILVGLASVWFLRGLGEILAKVAPLVGLDSETGDMLAGIFGQLQTAELNLPLEATGVACFLLCALLLWLCMQKTSKNTIPGTEEKKKGWIGRILLTTVVLLILALPLTAVNIWFTDVNDIRFDRVMAQLIPMLQSGIL